MLTYIPIDPSLTKSGSITSLVPLLGSKNAKPVALSSDFDGNLEITSRSISIRTAGKLNLGTIFSSELKANEIGFYYDSMLQEAATDEVNSNENGIAATRWGVGLRILLRIQSFDANASLNLGTVGAAVELGTASAEYQIMAYGLTRKVYSYILAQTAQVGKFTYDTYYNIDKNIIKKLSEVIGDEKVLLKPKPVAVSLRNPIDSITDSRSVYFAMRCLADRLKLEKALSKAGIKYNRDTIRDVYIDVGKIPDIGIAVPREVERRAEAWLKV